MPKYSLASTSWDEAEYRAIEEVVKSGNFTMGERVRRYEREFAALFGSQYAVMVNSGSSANLLAMAAAMLRPGSRLQKGDEVLVPAVSWSTTFYPVHQYGLTLSFVDVDPQTLNIDLDKLEASITPRSRAVFAVNLLGNPNDFDRLQAICDRHGLILLEDNCESMGASYQGRQAGTFGLCGTFSSFFSHHISTMEGGMVTTDDEQVYHTLLSLRAHGWTREQPGHSHLRLENEDEFVNLFRFVLPGYNLRPLEMEGAIGSEQLKKLPHFVRERRRNAEIFVSLFQDFEHVRIQREVGESSWFGFSLILTGALRGRRKDVVAELRANDVECRPIVAGNFLRNPVIKHLDHVVRQPITAADEVDNEGLFIGNHHYDIAEQLQHVRSLLAGLAAKQKEPSA